MPLWSSWMDLSCLTACLLMIRMQIHWLSFLGSWHCWSHILIIEIPYIWFNYIFWRKSTFHNYITKNTERQLINLNTAYTYKEKMEGLCTQIFDAGLSQHTQRTAEVECFFGCYREAVADNQQRAAQIAADFESSRRQVGHFNTALWLSVRHWPAGILTN